VEAVNLPVSVLYQTKSGKTEPFQRDKLFVSIYEACRHRKDAANVATDLTNTIIGKLLSKIDHASLSRQQIIETTSEVLKNFDKASVVQYRAYHPI
jgi:transcriptional regulator NrdR family protein